MRHPRLNSDAKLLLIYVQGLPETASVKPLGEHATDLGMRPRAYHKARECLTACGYLHEWKWQSQRGRWTTEQLLSNVTLTREEASGVRDGVPADSPDADAPTCGFLGARKPGTLPPVDKDGEKTSPHPPTKAHAPDPTSAPSQEPAPQPEAAPNPEPAPEPEAAPNPEPAPQPEAAPEPPPAPAPEAATPSDLTPEAVEAERVLLSLRHQSRDLLLGVREARGLAEAAAEWLRRGVSVADLRHALTAHLPRGGVRSAVGFLRHRLIEKLPAEPRPAATVALAAPHGHAAPAPDGRPALVTCEGEGRSTHVFRPAAGETLCSPCRQEAARRAHPHLQQPAKPRPAWRDLVAEVVQEGAYPQVHA
ncbi:hypothetical protein [Streptomyces sp. NPDC093795]|uniref:hypothetical protein n=1 Tax=Streptomyces sp. NPDC093795 TaxID=3366051 RepID=UPI0037F398F5